MIRRNKWATIVELRKFGYLAPEISYVVEKKYYGVSVGLRVRDDKGELFGQIYLSHDLFLETSKFMRRKILLSKLLSALSRLETQYFAARYEMQAQHMWQKQISIDGIVRIMAVDPPTSPAGDWALSAAIMGFQEANKRIMGLFNRKAA